MRFCHQAISRSGIEEVQRPSRGWDCPPTVARHAGLPFGHRPEALGLVLKRCKVCPAVVFGMFPIFVLQELPAKRSPEVAQRPGDF